MIENPDSVQTRIGIGQITAGRKNPAYLPALVAPHVLSGPSHRLTERLTGLCRIRNRHPAGGPRLALRAARDSNRGDGECCSARPRRNRAAGSRTDSRPRIRNGQGTRHRGLSMNNRHASGSGHPSDQHWSLCRWRPRSGPPPMHFGVDRRRAGGTVGAPPPHDRRRRNIAPQLYRGIPRRGRATRLGPDEVHWNARPGWLASTKSKQK